MCLLKFFKTVLVSLQMSSMNVIYVFLIVFIFAPLVIISFKISFVFDS